ncbi:MAG: hypothetical protein ACK45U_09625 [bacterium]|jgi:hypothetical protein
MLDLFKQSFQITKKNIIVLLGLSLTIGIILFVTYSLQALLQNNSIMSFIANFAFTLLRVFVSVALLKLCLILIDNREPEFSDIKPNWNETLRYLMLNLLMTVIVMVVVMLFAGFLGMLGLIRPGLMELYQNMMMKPEELTKYTSNEILYALMALLLLLLPAMLLMMRLQFATYYIIDKKMDIAAALMRSLAITKGYLFYVVLVFLLIILLNIIGLLFAFVGLLFTIPMTMIIIAMLYKSLDENYVEVIKE